MSHTVTTTGSDFHQKRHEDSYKPGCQRMESQYWGVFTVYTYVRGAHNLLSDINTSPHSHLVVMPRLSQHVLCIEVWFSKTFLII